MGAQSVLLTYLFWQFAYPSSFLTDLRLKKTRSCRRFLSQSYRWGSGDGSSDIPWIDMGEVAVEKEG